MLASFHLQVVAFILFYFYGLEQYMFDELEIEVLRQENTSQSAAKFPL